LRQHALFRTEHASRAVARFDPTVIVALIRGEVDTLIDPVAWRKALAREKRERKLLAVTAENWAKVQKLLRRKQ
jgi:hypothetical protein